MPAKMDSGRYPRKRYVPRRYVPQSQRIPTVRRPLASKYGDELFLKVQKVVPLVTQNALGDVFLYMRQDVNASSATVVAVYDQPEFVPFQKLYGFYEVRAMKMEMTCADTARATGAGIYAGIAPGLIAAPPVPSNDDIVKLPIQTKGNTQGQMFFCYYAYSKDLKAQGAQFAIPSTDVYGNGNCGVMIARM